MACKFHCNELLCLISWSEKISVSHPKTYRLESCVYFSFNVKTGLKRYHAPQCAWFFYFSRIVHHFFLFWLRHWWINGWLHIQCHIQNISDRKQMLYNFCWHRFGVHSWWPRVLWQAVTLWLVNREMAMRWGRPFEQVCNREGTM